ncbi:hypothetical protein PM082_018434 [Marasmius tenuissimus]|nr:hypothetical protein PM082_018434 [Marasmius tenuissimus]
MILKKGQDRGSFIWGSYLALLEIERLWVEVGRQFGRQWRAFFYRLESLHGLKRSDRHHIWLLQYLFLDMINIDCDKFREEWNAHPISGEGLNMSPNHGVDREHRPRPGSQTGAGTLSDEEFSETENAFSDASSDSDMEELGLPPGASQVFAGLGDLMERVHVPRHSPPLDAVELELFERALGAAEEQGFLPEGYSVLPEEWEGGEYPSYELLRSGNERDPRDTCGLAQSHLASKG